VNRFAQARCTQRVSGRGQMLRDACGERLTQFPEQGRPRRRPLAPALRAGPTRGIGGMDGF
jgi:hypothetical protein